VAEPVGALAEQARLADPSSPRISTAPDPPRESAAGFSSSERVLAPRPTSCAAATAMGR